MARLATSLVRRRHAWTSVNVPWRIDVGDDSRTSISVERRSGWRLFHYLSGGGIRAFAGSVLREEVSRRQTRFFYFAGGIAIAWLVLRHV